MVLRMFDDLSAEIDAQLDTDAMRSEYATYRAKVVTLISDAFPQ
jgi:hypothetical protein